MIYHFRTAQRMRTPLLPPPPPKTHEEANDAQFEQLLQDCDDVELLRAMCRQLRRDYLGAKFAAETNRDTVIAMSAYLRAPQVNHE